MNRKSLRIAVIGLGKMGLLHASILNVLPNVQLIATCDKSAVVRKFCKRMFDGVHVVDDVEKLSDLNLDAVYVTTPISSHFSVIKAIYSKGVARNVFVEKTLASSYDKARELCQLAQSFGGVNMVGYQRRLNVSFKKAKDLLTQGIIGEVTSFDAYAYSSDLLRNKKNSKSSVFRGGVLRDLGAHVVDLALLFFGDLTVDSARQKSATDRDSEDSVYLRVKGSNGLEGEFNISWCMENYRLPEFGLLIKGSKGIVKVNDDKVELRLDDGKSSTWYRHDLSDNVDFLLGAPEYFREDKCFVKSVLDGRNIEPSFYTASKVDYIIDQVKYRSSENE
ncbi:MAG: Gfo/Idh/MocA family oxidoreductase [Candidatus Bathyarchaeota archaeon]|nr:Gfo/Idh/MocA family oxidoreductase [Candidatus Bathyarchaeota archaeon]